MFDKNALKHITSVAKSIYDKQKQRVSFAKLLVIPIGLLMGVLSAKTECHSIIILLGTLIIMLYDVILGLIEKIEKLTNLINNVVLDYCDHLDGGKGSK